jgi:hypothetical protein
VLIETDLSNPGPLYSLYLYGEKPATIYDLRARDQAIDANAIFGKVNDHTAFNTNALYAGSTVTYANSADGLLAWQKAIDDNPETGVILNGSANEPGMVIKYGDSEAIARVAVLTDANAKGKLDFFVIDDTAETTSLEGKTPTVTMVLDGTNNRASMDIPSPVKATKLAVRWTPDTPNDTVTIRELNSFGAKSLNDYEVGIKPEAVAAYDTGAHNNGTGKGEGKEGKEPIAEGPPGVADFRGGSPYLPGALGFPPNIDSRRFSKPLSPK